jgi:hypothetical protein
LYEIWARERRVPLPYGLELVGETDVPGGEIGIGQDSIGLTHIGIVYECTETLCEVELDTGTP